MNDPHWPRASGWLAGASPEPLLVVAGIPSSVASITPSRARLAPAALRETLARFSVYHGEHGVDLRELPVRDLGDLDLDDGDLERAQGQIRAAAARIPEGPVRVFFGGDNAITRPLLAAAGGAGLHRVGLVTLDAHHDARVLDDGPTNGTPVRGLIEEEGLPGANVVQIGIHTFANSPRYRAWCEERGVTVITLRQVEEHGVRDAVRRALEHLDGRCDRIYVDFDLDVLDRAFAPACPGARPGGMAPRDLFEAAFLLGRHRKVDAADLVEVDPTADPDGRTLDAMALTFLSFAAGVASRGGRGW